MAAFSGLRLGELRALRWKDVDFASHFLYVRHNYTSRALGDPKSGKVRSVPMIDQAASALDGLSRRERFIDSDDLVFCSETGKYIDESALCRRFHAALGRAELKRIRFHDLRHTFGTLAVQAWPLHDVQGYMGHAEISTTMVYVHHQPRAAAAAELTRLVQAQTSVAVMDESVSRTVSRNAEI